MEGAVSELVDGGIEAVMPRTFDSVDYVVHFSGGLSSWCAAERTILKFGQDKVILLFADTLGEDEDLYRFLIEGAAVLFDQSKPGWAANLGRVIPSVEDSGNRQHFLLWLKLMMSKDTPNLVWLQEGRTIWEVFRDERFLGNSKVDPCSKTLKRELLDSWCHRNLRHDVTHIFGFDWSEGHRLDRMNAYDQSALKRKAPLLDPPYLSKAQMVDLVRFYGIEPPRTYAMGFSHNNCGGGCVKAGQASFALLLRTMPERYAFWEQKEAEMRQYLGKPVSILTDRRGDGIKKPLSLREFRERLAREGKYDESDWGSCGCFQVEPTPEEVSA